MSAYENELDRMTAERDRLKADVQQWERVGAKMDAGIKQLEQDLKAAQDLLRQIGEAEEHPFDLWVRDYFKKVSQ